ncbi:MAG: hypothetical protein WA880_14485 [Ornithinimicrobium sp.]
MNTPGLLGQLRPKNYTRGRLAAIICGIYLAVILAAWLYALFDAYFVENIGASFAGLYLLVLSAPLSFLMTSALDAMNALDPEGPIQEFIFWLGLLVPAVIQAGIGWLVLRGRRVVNSSGAEAAHA